MQPQVSEQRSAEWFKARWGVATASKFADIIAVGAKGQPLAGRTNYLSDLVTERLTPPPVEDDGYKNASMAWGIENEELARLAYELATDNSVEDAFFEKHTKLEAGASPDGYVGEVGLIEIKCPNTATHLATLKRQTVPTQYLPQIQGQLWITGRDWCDFISYDPRLISNAQLFIKRVERDNAYIAKLEEHITKFLKEVEEEVEFVRNYKP